MIPSSLFMGFTRWRRTERRGAVGREERRWVAAQTVGRMQAEKWRKRNKVN